MGRRDAVGDAVRAVRDAQCGLSDRVSRGHARQLLGGPDRRRAGATAGRRHHRLPARRCARALQQAGHAPQTRHGVLRRRREDTAAFPASVRRRRPRRNRRRLRLSRLRRATVQPAVHGLAALPAPARIVAASLGLAQPHRPGRGRRIGQQAFRRRERARPPERIDVHRGGAQLHPDAVGGGDRLARRPRRQAYRKRIERDARHAGAGVDAGRPGEDGRPVAFGVRGALHASARPAADPVSHRVAHAACDRPARQHQRTASRRLPHRSATNPKPPSAARSRS